ncbi:Rhodanese domain-containing protein [Entamoeba marina]
MSIPQSAIKHVKDAIDSGDITLARELCRQFGVPDQYRLEVWKLFLQPHKEIVEEKTNSTYRSHFLDSKDEQLILKSNQIASTIHPIGTQPYLNCIADIASVVLILFPNESVEMCCGMTKAILYKYHPFYKHLYPSVITGLQNLIHILLLYHDPILSLHLDTNRIEPIEYTNRFAFNLCVSMCSTIDTIAKVWDDFITYPDTTLFTYCIIGYLICNREKILACKTHQTVLECMFQRLDIDELLTIVAYSKAIRLSTSSSYNRILISVTNNTELYQKLFSKTLASSLFLPSLTNDIVNDKVIRQVPYLFIDCRKEERFELGTIAAAINLDYSKRQNIRNYMDELFQKELSLLTQQYSVFHVVLFGEDDNEENNPDIGELTMIALDFAKRGVKRISIMSQGFVVYHKNAMLQTNNYTLMNHEVDNCPLCTGKPIKSELFAETKKLTQSITQTTVERTQKMTSGLKGFLYGNSEKKEESKQKEQIENKEEHNVEEQNDSNEKNKVDNEVEKQEPSEVNNQNQPSESSELVEDDDDDYLKELIEESSKFNSYLNIGGKQVIWKPVLTVLTTVSMLIVEQTDSKVILLEDISYETINKIIMKKSDPERFTIDHSNGRCVIRVPEAYERFVEDISNLKN